MAQASQKGSLAVVTPR